jgi:hypothetical protein
LHRMHIFSPQKKQIFSLLEMCLHDSQKPTCLLSYTRSFGSL